MEPVAIIGMGCRFPKAENPGSFWDLLRNGIDAIAPVPANRWDIDRFYHPERIPGKIITRYGGFIEGLDRFDADLFGVSPEDAQRIDPQQKLMLQVAWEALADAGIVPASLSGTSAGVFIGISKSDHNRAIYGDLELVGPNNISDSSLSIVANRLSFCLQVNGPSMAIDTTCSSALVALHLACQSLRSGESELAIVGGISLNLTPDEFIVLSLSGLLSPDGRCKTFDAKADGYGRGEGCGVVVIKLLNEAIANGDNILAVIRGSAVNHNGLSNGLTSPSGLAQQAALGKALANAGVSGDRIGYVETHGTGTPLGDALEVKSLKAKLKSDRPCWLGSVKTNIGHLEAASGIASLIKTVLCLKNQEIPPHLHFQQLHPYISFKGTNFKIPTEVQPWQDEGESRLAGVSSFGIGGTNAHIILESVG
jgi:acyl transferase domain-containing protein